MDDKMINAHPRPGRCAQAKACERGHGKDTGGRAPGPRMYGHTPMAHDPNWRYAIRENTQAFRPANSRPAMTGGQRPAAFYCPLTTLHAYYSPPATGRLAACYSPTTSRLRSAGRLLLAD